MYQYELQTLDLRFYKELNEDSKYVSAISLPRIFMMILSSDYVEKDQNLMIQSKPIYMSYKEYNELHETVVTVKKMEDYEIVKYIDETNPYDKAGAYAIQGEFALFIEKIRGSYSSVVGLPIERVYEILKENEILGII